MIVNEIIGGGTGAFASIAVKGQAEETDTVYAVNGAERIDAVWNGEFFIIDKISTYGTWIVTAVRGTNIRTYNIDVEEAKNYEVTAKFTGRINFSGGKNQNNAYYTINGVKHISDDSFDLPIGGTVGIYVGATEGSGYDSSCYVSLNGTVVQRGKGLYTYTVDSDANVVFGRGQQSFYYANITTY